MSDRTNLQVYVYGCPEDQREAAAEVLDDLGMGWGTGRNDGTLRLDEPYTEHEATCGSADQIAGELTEAAPGVSFVIWEDPAYEWLGSLEAHTPELGPFNAQCTADGDVVFGYHEAADVISKAAKAGEDVLAALHKAMGQPWLEDWHKAISARTPAAS